MKFLQVLLILSGLSTLVACDASHVDGATQNFSSSQEVAVSVEALDAYQSSVYAFGQSQGCVRCHATKVSPHWMSTNIDLAYSVARPLLDINNSSVSVFAYYAGNNHCNDPICSNPANVTTMQGLLAQWSATEIIISGGGSQPITGGALAVPNYRTATMPMPATLPTIFSAAPAVIRFQLSQLQPAVPALANAILEISVQSYNLANSQYKVFNPRIIGATASVTVKGLHAYIRPSTGTGIGIEDVYQGDLWANVTGHITPSTIPNPLPTAPIAAVSPIVATALGIQAQSTSDMITIGFLEIH